MRLLIDILYGFGISCGILFAYFRMLDAGQTVKKNEETKLSFFLLGVRLKIQR